MGSNLSYLQIRRVSKESLDDLEKETIAAIDNMAEVEAWPLDDVVSELVRVGMISEDEIPEDPMQSLPFSTESMHLHEEL